jgi:hypothetical protein
MRLMRKPSEPLRRPCSYVVVDDDLGGPYPAPSRSTFLETLRAQGVEVAPLAEEAMAASLQGTRLIAVYADIRGWKGRPGLSAASRERLRRALAGPGSSLVVLFSHPWNAKEVPPSIPVICAWGGEPLMQEAAARAVARLVAG